MDVAFELSYWSAGSNEFVCHSVRVRERAMVWRVCTEYYVYSCLHPLISSFMHLRGMYYLFLHSDDLIRSQRSLGTTDVETACLV
jgi:hypothetical protein